MTSKAPKILYYTINSSASQKRPRKNAKCYECGTSIKLTRTNTQFTRLVVGDAARLFCVACSVCNHVGCDSTTNLTAADSTRHATIYCEEHLELMRFVVARVASNTFDDDWFQFARYMIDKSKREQSTLRDTISCARVWRECQSPLPVLYINGDYISESVYINYMFATIK